jgi:hypothetical protein
VLRDHKALKVLKEQQDLLRLLVSQFKYLLHQTVLKLVMHPQILSIVIVQISLTLVVFIQILLVRVV